MAIIATWNLENLFRPGGDFVPKTNAVYETKLDGLARVIEAIAPGRPRRRGGGRSRRVE
jgi:hypothetical protein